MEEPFFLLKKGKNTEKRFAFPVNVCYNSEVGVCRGAMGGCIRPGCGRVTMGLAKHFNTVNKA